MTHPEDQEPQGWRKLCEMAQEERNPKKLAALLERINGLLTMHENKSRHAS
jgi:hypothetical protein